MLLYYSQQTIHQTNTPKPGTSVYINPSKIIYTNDFGNIYKSGLILKDEWDQKINLFKETIRYQSVYERIINERKWEETGIIQIINEEVHKKPGYDGLCSTKDIIKRYENLDKLITQLKKGDPFMTATELNQNLLRHDSPMVNIDRNGNVLLSNGGHHRVAIAACVGLKKIPVTIGCIHFEAASKNIWSNNIIID